MRIDPANKIEVEIVDLQSQINDLKKECMKYFRLVEEIKSRRDGWKQNRMMNRYGSKF